VVLVNSADRGHTWRYYGTVATTEGDPNPELSGDFGGMSEPAIAMLANGQMLGMIRTQGAHLPAQYRPLYVCWSDDMGKTWTKPGPTRPHLMNIWPTLQVLDNGVVACIYGRPGFHVAFSLDDGHTWQDRVSFSHLPEPVITGQVDGVKVGPNKLVAIGATERGTLVFPITVARKTVSRARMALMGRVLDEQGGAIAGALVECGPNRYRADSWRESTELDPWKIGPKVEGSPELGYQSIQPKNGHPTATTDGQGRFRFESVRLGEHIVTVEAEGFAPEIRRVKVGPAPDTNTAEFSLKPGRAVRGRVLDSGGTPVAGASVVLNMWHVYSDRDGFFDWSAQAPVPQRVEMKVYRRYDPTYERYEGTVELSQLEKLPVVLGRK
jgi:protocatechuate 3,4-dioxygenase beta subunit